MYVGGWVVFKEGGRGLKAEENKSTVSRGPFTNYSQLHFGCSAVWMKSKMTCQEQIQNNKHNFLRNNWIALLLKKFSLQTVEWKWHDILSISGRPPSHHRLCLAISVLTAPLIRSDTVLNSRVLFFFPTSKKNINKAPTTWPCRFIAYSTITARVIEFHVKSHSRWNAPEMAYIGK